MLTEAEHKWVKRVQRALSACPTDRIGFYTIGDRDVMLYRKPERGDLEHHDPLNAPDFCTIVSNNDAELGQLKFPALVHSTAG